jgi:hypothetical protein
MPVLYFGRHAGERLDAVPCDYLRWLCDPARDTPEATARRGRRGTHKPLPREIVEKAREILPLAEAREAMRLRAKALLGGAGHEGSDPIHIVTVEGDLLRRRGLKDFGLTIHPSLDEALAMLAEQYPIVPEDQEEAEFHGREPGSVMVRLTPDPEDDRILIWEVLPSGHRKVVWAFSGWHWNDEDHACGQGTLPGDDDTLYGIAIRDC